MAVLKREAAALATVLSAALSEPFSDQQETAATVLSAAAVTAEDPTVTVACSNTGRTADTSAVVDGITASCTQQHKPTALHDTNKHTPIDIAATRNTQSVSRNTSDCARKKCMPYICDVPRDHVFDVSATCTPQTRAFGVLAIHHMLT